MRRAEPDGRAAPTPGDPDRSGELRKRRGWAWTRVMRRYDDYERALARLESTAASTSSARPASEPAATPAAGREISRAAARSAEPVTTSAGPATTSAEPAATSAEQAATSPSLDERRTSPLELLWDLVFVFAITQVTTLLANHLTWAGFGRSMLVLALIWWAWSAFVWAANAQASTELSFRVCCWSRPCSSSSPVWRCRRPSGRRGRCSRSRTRSCA